MLHLLQSIPSNLLSSQSNVGVFPTCSQVRIAIPETWVQGGTPGLCGTLGILPHSAHPSLPALPASRCQNLPVWPQTKGGANLRGVFSSCCSQEVARSGLCSGSLRRWKRPQRGGASRAVQPACTFSCFVLKYPLVSFFTSYSLYPKLCISPLNGVIFLIAGRVLLLDTSLLLVRCAALRRAR